MAAGNLTIFSAFEPDGRPTLYVGVMRRNHLFAAASICLALIVYATLARLAGRPALMGHHEAYWVVVIERFSAYGLLGFLLSFLLPGRFALACSLVITVAMGLELLQAFTPDRDPGFLDVLQKAAGGTVGVMLAQMILAFLPRPPS
jgi:VanZ family protein